MRSFAPRGRAIRSVALATLLLLTAACGLPSGSGSTGGTGTIQMGLIVGQSGIYGIQGPSIQAGVDIATDEINKAGGIKVGGKSLTLKFVSLDDRSDPQVALADAIQMFRDDKINILFGPVALAGITVAPVAAQNNAINISPSTAAQSLVGTSKYPLLFSQAPSVNFRVGASVAGMKHWWPNIKKVAVMAPNDAITQLVVPVMTNQAIAAGLTVDSFLYPPGSTDLSAIATKVIADKPDIIWSSPSSQEVLNVDKQLTASGLPKDIPILAYGITSDVLQQFDRPVANQATSAFDPIGEANAPNIKGFIDAVKPKIPAGASLQGAVIYYFVVRVVAKALEKAGTTTDVKAIAAAMTQVSAHLLGQDFAWGPDRQFTYPIASTFWTPGQTGYQVAHISP